MHDNSPGNADPAAQPATSGPMVRSPGRAVVAGGLGIVFVVMLWTLKGAGPIALIAIPVMVLWVANVYLGGGLNQSPLAGIDRIRKWRNQR